MPCIDTHVFDYVMFFMFSINYTSNIYFFRYYLTKCVPNSLIKKNLRNLRLVMLRTSAGLRPDHMHKNNSIVLLMKRLMHPPGPYFWSAVVRTNSQ